MAHVIENVVELSAMLRAPKAVVLVSVAWSPWPRKSRSVLAALESSQEVWTPDSPVEFFDFWPERDDALNRWFDEQCRGASPRFDLHGHGYGPLWWLVSGIVLGCLTEPYRLSIEELQERSVAFFNDGRAIL